MYSFMREQSILEVGGVRFGGQPGENPTVLIGTVFYGKDYKVMDDAAFAKAKEYTLMQDAISAETGIPGILDIYIKDEKYIETEIDVVIGSTDGPFSIDSSDAHTRVKTLEYLAKVGALQRTIYNSINLGLTEEEIGALGRYTPEAVLVLAYNPRDMGVDGRLDMLKTGSGMICVAGKGLLGVASDAGIEKVLLDTGATPFGSMSAETLRAIPVFKNEFGLPVGCSIHNTLESWGWMKDRRKTDPEAYNCADAAANAMVPLSGGDFIVYGPVSSCGRIFPSVAFADKLLAEGGVDYFGLVVGKEHPYFKLK
ncbi:MAG: tetrahydromethanopterin S-methyltransferase subunit H [Candidatus Altiarchaeota archaeon]